MQKVGLYVQKLANRRFITGSLSCIKVVHTESGALRCVALRYGSRVAAHCLACYERVLMYAACYGIGYCGILRHVAAKTTQHAAGRRIRCERTLTHWKSLSVDDVRESCGLLLTVKHSTIYTNVRNVNETRTHQEMR